MDGPEAGGCSGTVSADRAHRGYRAASSDPEVATVRVAGAVLTLTAVVYGSAMVTVTAEDSGGFNGDADVHRGGTTVWCRAVLGNTLAAMARCGCSTVGTWRVRG